MAKSPAAKRAVHYVKLCTSDGETRWVNLAQVSRVTMASVSADEPLLVVFFADADPESKLEIRGSDEANRQAIANLTARLDELSFAGS